MISVEGNDQSEPHMYIRYPVDGRSAYVTYVFMPRVPAEHLQAFVTQLERVVFESPEEWTEEKLVVAIAEVQDAIVQQPGSVSLGLFKRLAFEKVTSNV